MSIYHPILDAPEDDLIGPAENSLDLLRQVYSSPSQPISRRMRAAIAALPFEHPKLAVTATIDGGPGFAARLEEAIARSRMVIENGSQAEIMKLKA